MQTLAPTWELRDTTTAKWYLRLFPSLNDLAFLVPIVVLFARMSGTQLLFADGDTGWHIRTGEWILDHRAVPTVDLFSFTKSSEAWFAWEWGWDVVFAAIHHAAGLAGVGFVTTLMLGFVSLLVYRLSLRVSGNNAMSMVVTIIAAAVSSIHWLARPHIVSWLFVLLFLNILESARAGSKTSLYKLPLLMAVWVNFHGGFVAGLIFLGCYSLGEGLKVLFDSNSPRQAWHHSARYWGTFALCALATFVNPYGFRLHQHIYAYLTDSELLDKIQEFQSISFHAGPAIFFECMLLLGAFVAYDYLRKREFTPALLMCFWAHYALLSARHIPLFMMVASPFAAKLLAQSVERAKSIKTLAVAADTISLIGSDLGKMELTPRLHVISALALPILAALFALGQAPFVPQFNSETFPAQAMAVIRPHVGSRIFTTDQWGDYLIYRMYPAQRVFFDGRSDFYGNDFAKVNQRILSAEYDWKSQLEKFGIALVVLKPQTPLSAVLKLTPGATVLFDDGKVIVFDTSGIYEFSPDKREAVKRTVSFSPKWQPPCRYLRSI